MRVLIAVALVASVLAESPLDVPNVLVQYPLEKNGTSTECRACVCNVTHHIVHHVFEHMAKKCNETKCPFFQHLCKGMEAHKNFTAGLIVGTTRAPELGFAYCMGKGVCEHPNCSHNKTDSEEVQGAAVVATFGDLLEPAAAEAEEQLRAEEPAEPRGMLSLSAESWPHHRNHSGNGSWHHGNGSWHHRNGSWHHRNGSWHHGNGSWHHGNHSHRKPGPDMAPCVGCVFRGMHHIMRFVVGMIAKKCNETKDAHVAEMCAWAKEHPAFVFGVLVAKVEPWKRAGGYCAALGFCPRIGGRHHGHHGDGHHGHHGGRPHVEFNGPAALNDMMADAWSQF